MKPRIIATNLNRPTQVSNSRVGRLPTGRLRVVRSARHRATLVAVAAVLPSPALVSAAVEQSNGSQSNFGFAVAESGDTSVVGAPSPHFVAGTQYNGLAYLFRNVSSDTGTVTQDVMLSSSDGANAAYFGDSISFNGSTALVGAFDANVGGNSEQGAAYVFRQLDTASGTVTQNAKLIASDGAAGDQFGTAVSLSGSAGLVGAPIATVAGNSSQGAAYLFRNLDTVTGTVTEGAKLVASDGSANAYFGYAVSLNGSTGLIGAYGANVGTHTAQGAAYVFRNLGAASGTVTQAATLVASDGVANDNFGFAVSLSGGMGLVGAFNATVGGNAGAGAAYLFRNLNAAAGTTTQDAKLTPLNPNVIEFGYGVSLSGNTGLVGADGAAYIFMNLASTATGVTEDVKLTASTSVSAPNFGYAVSLDGDQFTVGGEGKAYTGAVSAVTTLDAGNTARVIGGINFVSQDDWVIGQTSSGNQVTLGNGSVANVTASGRAVYVGRTAGSNNNTLIVNGSVVANSITIGAAGGTIGNSVRVNNDGGATAVGSVSASGGITVYSGGTLALNDPSGGNLIVKATPLTLAGGTFNLGGITESAGNLGALSLSATSTLDFGTPGTPNYVQFSGLGSHTLGQRLQVIDWEGTPGVPGGNDNEDSLLFTGSASAFMLAYPQSDVSFDGVSGYDILQESGTVYEVYAVPEPASILLMAPALAPMWLGRRKRRSRSSATDHIGSAAIVSSYTRSSLLLSKIISCRVRPTMS